MSGRSTSPRNTSHQIRQNEMFSSNRKNNCIFYASFIIIMRVSLELWMDCDPEKRMRIKTFNRLGLTAFFEQKRGKKIFVILIDTSENWVIFRK